MSIPIFLTLLPVFIAAETIGRIHIQAHRLMEGIYEVALQMGSIAMIYIPRFIKTGSDIQKLI
jgi:hypothetical protein